MSSRGSHQYTRYGVPLRTCRRHTNVVGHTARYSPPQHATQLCRRSSAPTWSVSAITPQSIASNTGRKRRVTYHTVTSVDLFVNTSFNADCVGQCSTGASLTEVTSTAAASKRTGRQYCVYVKKATHSQMSVARHLNYPGRHLGCRTTIGHSGAAVPTCRPHRLDIWKAVSLAVLPTYSQQSPADVGGTANV